MEDEAKNAARLSEIEKEIADLNEQKHSLDGKFENEKAVFGGISNAKKEIDSLKNKAEMSNKIFLATHL